MTDEKILDLKTGKPFELVSGGDDGPSPAPIVELMKRLTNYAIEKKYVAVAVALVDEKGASITAHHMEENSSSALAGTVGYVLHRINRHMDSE